MRGASGEGDKKKERITSLQLSEKMRGFLGNDTNGQGYLGLSWSTVFLETVEKDARNNEPIVVFEQVSYMQFLMAQFVWFGFA